MFFLITFLLSILAIGLSWTNLATTRIGLTDIFPHIYKALVETMKSQGVSIFAFAFFLYAVLQSQAFQALFNSKRKWLQKRKYFAISLITICVALLSSNLSWFDEFVHFYPLVIPLMLSMGFDFFSSVLCLYGGSIAGLLGLVSTQRITRHFDRCFVDIKGKINYNGLMGIGFRMASFIIFISIVILFNIWYCNRNQVKFSSAKEDKLSEQEISVPFDRIKKIVLAVAGFFLLTSFLAQIPSIAEGFKLDRIAEKIPEHVTNEVEGDNKYKDLGRIEEMEVAKVIKKKDKNWGIFGKWSQMAIDCWLVIGGIIICLLVKQNIMENFIVAAQKGIPLALIYAFASVPATIISKSGVSNWLANKIIPNTANTAGASLGLFSIFGLCFLICFFIDSTSIGVTLVKTLAPALLAFGESTLIYAALFAWVGVIIGMAFSPFNGILQASLEKSQIPYKQFIKKVWVLGLIMMLAAIGLVSFWAKFVIKN